MQSSPSASSISGKATSTSYIPGLDGIRAVAFSLVFLAHATPGRVSTYVPATLGVTIFFFLSGYLITTLLRAEILRTGTISLRDFYIRRTLRIFVPLYLAYSIAAILSRFALHLDPGNRLGVLAMLFYFYNYAIALHWPAVVPMGLTVIWSLAVEEHFYLLFPLGYLALVRRGLSPAKQTRILVFCCLGALLWRTVILALFQPHNWTYVATDSRFDSILWGSILAIRNNPRFADPPLLSRRQRFPAFLSGLTLIVLTLLVRPPAFRETLRYTLQALSLYLIFSFILTEISHPTVRWLEWRAVRYIGWISYSLYLVHVFILATLRIYVPNRLWLTSSLGLAIAILYGTVLRYTVELPLQTLRARFRHVPEADPTAADAHGLIS